MKKFKAFMAAAMAAAAVFTLTSCEELGFGKDYFFGHWDSGFYSVDAETGAPDMITKDGEEVPGVKDGKTAYRVQWYFNGNGDSILNGGKGIFYQIRTEVSNYNENKFVDDPNDKNKEDKKSMIYDGAIDKKSFYFGTYKTGENSGVITGRFELSYKYGYKLGAASSDTVYEDDLARFIEMAMTQGKSSGNGAAKFMAEMISKIENVDKVNELLGIENEPDKIQDGLKDANGKEWVFTKKDLVKLLKYRPIYEETNNAHEETTGQLTGMYSNSGYTLYVKLDENGKELCGDVESFAYEFGEPDLTGYRKLTAVSNPEDEKCKTINEWAQKGADYYETPGCTWSEYAGKKKATRILKWKKSLKPGEALDDLDISGLDQ